MTKALGCRLPTPTQFYDHFCGHASAVRRADREIWAGEAATHGEFQPCGPQVYVLDPHGLAPDLQKRRRWTCGSRA